MINYQSNLFGEQSDHVRDDIQSKIHFLPFELSFNERNAAALGISNTMPLGRSDFQGTSATSPNEIRNEDTEATSSREVPVCRQLWRFRNSFAHTREQLAVIFELRPASFEP